MDYLTAPPVEWAVASRSLEPEASGDAYVVHPAPGGALFGVVDGLGHGPGAAAVAREAVRILSGAVAENPVAALRLCHERLRATRGVVMTLAWMDSERNSMTWLGVGNVQAILLHAGHDESAVTETLVGRRGIVGRLLPPLSAGIVAIAPGDLLVLATDGIRPSFMSPLLRSRPPRSLADDILARHWTGSDDALVLVVRYQGAQP
jgi:negative regulator of sigma-B (phosphoserine phosphatase)